MEKHYDFIIVGAGSAGCVIATQLIEKTTGTVLLLEAGKQDSTIHAKIPASMPYMMENHVWKYVSEPEAYLNGRIMDIPQGKIIGGSSSVNGMAYVRGVAEDYDAWESEFGCKGWNYEAVLKAFIASENNESLTSPYHGNAGHQYVSENRYRHPLTLAFIRAGQELGYDYVNDFNGAAKNNVVGFFQATVYQGRRASTSYAWLDRVRKNTRLTIQTNCLVEKVLVEDETAIGIQVLTGNRQVAYLANKEAILASGAFGSPKILLLSGIGPKSELEALDIASVVDSPNVGKNLQDHLHVNIRGLLKEPISIISQNKGLKKYKNGLQWLLFKNGIASSNILEGCGFFDLDGDGRRDTQIHSFPLIENFGRQEKEPQSIEGFTLKLGQLYPKSRGEVTLRSKDPKDLPIIRANYFESESDLKAMVEAVKLGLKFFNTQNMREIIKDVIAPHPDIHMDDSALAEFVKDNSLTVFHPVGSCAMGGSDDSVLDEYLRVRGVKNLRVVDSASFPSIVSGNTNAPVIMLAYKGSEMIIEEHYSKSK